MGLSSEAMELPMDLVTGEILTRLPAKSLMRFKCVSKLWLSVISSEYFSNRFVTVPSPRLYMCLLDSSKNRKSVTLSLSLAHPGTSTTPSSFVVDHDLTIPRIGGSIWQKFRGFMLYTYGIIARIYNPATRQLVTVLPFIASKNLIVPPGARRRVFYYLGHDPVSDQYKVVSVITVIEFYEEPSPELKSETWVFDLKAGGGGSWRKAALTPPDFSPHQLPGNGGVCIDGVIYYQAWIQGYNSHVVVSFDVRTEEFNMIHVPRMDGDEKPRSIQNLVILECGGKVTLFDQTRLREKGVVALWVLEDARSNKWHWSCKRLVLQPCQLHLVNSIRFKIRGTTQKGKVLLVPEYLISPFHILTYDVQSNDMRKIEIRGIPDRWFSREKDEFRFELMFMDQSESVMPWQT